MGELEAGVGQSVYPLDHLGLPFNMLRAFRRLLFLDTAEVMGSPLVRELPASVMLHHLYSRAPAGLQSPHVRQSFTPAQVNTTAGLTLPRQTLVSVLQPRSLQLRANVSHAHLVCTLPISAGDILLQTQR